MRTHPCTGSTYTVGFTLIEAMITVAVLALLASMALPSYRDYVVRARLEEAPVELSRIAVALEQFYQDNLRYGTGTACPAAAPANANFQYACSFGTGGQTYQVSATGTAASGTAGFGYALNQTGQRTTTRPTSWGGNMTGCWLTQKGGNC